MSHDAEFWADAACIPKDGISFDDGLWFPSGTGPNYRAKAICRTCPVWQACLEQALKSEPRVEGIWAGTTEREREAMRAGRKVAEKSYIHGTEHGFRREVAAGETPCEACTAARDVANAKRARTAKAAKARSEASRAVTSGGLTARRVG